MKRQKLELSLTQFWSEEFRDELATSVRWSPDVIFAGSGSTPHKSMCTLQITACES